MFCSKCGAENSDASGFCTKCGAPIGSARKASPAGAGTGLEPNIAGLLSYVLGWITGIVFFLIEKEDDYVRFHAMQSIVVFGAFTVVQIGISILSFIPYVWILSSIVSGLLGLTAFILWIILMVKAYQGERYKVPYAGDLAEKHI